MNWFSVFLQLECLDIMQVLHEGLFMDDDVACVDSLFQSCKASNYKSVWVCHCYPQSKIHFVLVKTLFDSL